MQPPNAAARRAVATIASVVAISLIAVGLGSRSRTIVFNDLRNGGKPYGSPNGQSAAAWLRLPTGVYPGDQVTLSNQPDLGVRTTIVLGQASKSDLPLHILVTNGNSEQYRNVRPQTAQQWKYAAGTLWLSSLIFVIAGLVLLWRGLDTPSLWLGLFCLGSAPTLLGYFGLLPPGLRLAAWSAAEIFEYFGYFALFATAEALVGEALKEDVVREKAFRALRTIVIVDLSVLLAFTLAGTLGGALFRFELPSLPAFVLSILIATQAALLAGVPLLMLYSGSRWATGVERLRLRVALVTTLVGLIGPLYLLALYAANPNATQFGPAWLTIVGIPLGFLYAIYAYHVFDIATLINRAIVVFVMTMIVSLFIAFAESIAGEVAAGMGKGTIGLNLLTGINWSRFFETLRVELPAVFIIVVFLNRLHQWLESGVEKLFFRRRSEALEKMRRLRHLAASFLTRDALLERTIEDVQSAMGAKGVAIYEAIAPGHYRLTRRDQAGSWAFASDITKPDDPALCLMRSGPTPVQLPRIKSDLGSAGIAFRMFAGGKLSGMLVCAPRTNEEFEGVYGPEEREAAADVADEVAEALHAIRARENEDLVKAIAAGELSPEEAQARARELDAPA